MNQPYRISVSELLRLACLYAEQDRVAFIHAHGHMPDGEAVAEAKCYVSALRIYMQRRWKPAEFPEHTYISIPDLLHGEQEVSADGQ